MKTQELPWELGRDFDEDNMPIKEFYRKVPVKEARELWLNQRDLKSLKVTAQMLQDSGEGLLKQNQRLRKALDECAKFFEKVEAWLLGPDDVDEIEKIVQEALKEKE